jgi:hypothetical protein
MTKGVLSEATHRRMHRGEFLKHSLLVLIVGASCLLGKRRSPLAAERAGDLAQGPGPTPPASLTKPPLTEEHLNQFIAVVRKGIQPDSEALKTRATRDWRAVLRDQFALTPMQKRALEVLPKETVHQVQQSIRQAIHTNSGFVVRAVAASGAAPPLERPSASPPSTARMDAARLAAWQKPGSVECTKIDVTYECRVKAGVVC